MYSQELKNKLHDDPKNWKLGIFYFNKEDKKLSPLTVTFKVMESIIFNSLIS